MRRRWRWITIAVAIAGATALVWFVWVPEYRPELRPGERYGIDVSNHQGEIEWRRVAGDDIDFAYIKATEGANFTDKRFAPNWEGAAAAGIERGAYHFFTLCASGAGQARHFLDVVPRDPAALPPALDLELAGNCAARPSGEVVHRQLVDFLELVEEATAQQVIVYLGDDFERRYQVRRSLQRPLWHRRILLRPDVGGWVVWQVMGRARVEGIDGDVDLDVMRALTP